MLCVAENYKAIKIKVERKGQMVDINRSEINEFEKSLMVWMLWKFPCLEENSLG